MSLLHSPLRTPKFTLKNRLVMPPMATAKSNPQGHVTPSLLEYYDEKTSGGCFGLVIIEHSYI